VKFICFIIKNVFLRTWFELSMSHFLWIKSLSIRHETLKLQEKNLGETFQGINIDNDFLNRTLMPQGNNNKN
jgi:hypothetical protein